MGDLLYFPVPTPNDGGKSRIKRRRKVLFQLDSSPLIDFGCDLSMGHADPEDTRPSELA